MLKLDIKEWNKNVFGFLDIANEEKKEEIEKLDKVDDVFGLELTEIVSCKKLTTEGDLMFQKAKAWWILEGDSNSKFFHNWINRKNKVDGIEGVFVNNVWAESVTKVREDIFNHFKAHFNSYNSPAISFSASMFPRKIDQEDSVFLEATFTKTEVKAVVWSCDSNKSLGPDDFSFAFFKDN